jgi:Bacteriocin-protection, YdeI or OmpD-Associated
MGGKHLVPASADTRRRAGVARGDVVHVTLTGATAPRRVDVPDDLAAALAAAACFEGLSNSLQRMHVDNVNGAKSADTAVSKSLHRYRAAVTGHGVTRSRSRGPSASPTPCPSRRAPEVVAGAR